MGPKNSQTFAMLSSRLSFWGSGAPKKLSTHRIAAKKPKYYTRIGITKNSSTCTSGYSIAKANSSERDRQ